MEQVPEEQCICTTPNMYRVTRNLSRMQLQRMTRRERIRLYNNDRDRRNRRWRDEDLLAARRCLFPGVRDSSSDESGYSYESFLDSSFTGDEDEELDVTRLREMYLPMDTSEYLMYDSDTSFEDLGQEEWVSTSATETADEGDFSDDQATDSGHTPSSEEEYNEYMDGINLECEEDPSPVTEYPYAEDCHINLDVAYEVEIVTDN